MLLDINCSGSTEQFTRLLENDVIELIIGQSDAACKSASVCKS